MTMIETKDLTFAYPAEEGKRSEPALRGVSLGIEKGSFVVVLGHNGSGKSTLAKHMNAVLLPSGGAVYVEGMDTHNQAMLLEIRRRVGMVFQNPDNQIVANVVEEDVAFAPENLGVPPQEIRRRVEDVYKRQHSVLAAALEANEKARLIAVHDGARPLIRPEQIDELIRFGERTYAAAPAVPVSDTIKPVSYTHLWTWRT